MVPPFLSCLGKQTVPGYFPRGELALSLTQPLKRAPWPAVWQGRWLVAAVNPSSSVSLWYVSAHERIPQGTDHTSGDVLQRLGHHSVRCRRPRLLFLFCQVQSRSVMGPRGLCIRAAREHCSASDRLPASAQAGRGLDCRDFRRYPRALRAGLPLPGVQKRLCFCQAMIS